MYDRDPDKYFNEFRDPDLDGENDYDSSGYPLLGSKNSASYKAALEAARQAGYDSIQAAVDAAVAKLEGQRGKIDSQYQDSAQQAYINKMISQRDLPQAMSAGGLSGGMADSARLALETNYGNSLNSLEKSKNSAYNDLDSEINQARATGASQISQLEMQLAQQKAQYDYAAQQAQQELQNQLALLQYQYDLNSQAQAEQEAQKQRNIASSISSGTNGLTWKDKGTEDVTENLLKSITPAQQGAALGLGLGLGAGTLGLGSNPISSNNYNPLLAAGGQIYPNSGVYTQSGKRIR